MAMTPDGRTLQATFDALVETIKVELSAQIHVRGVSEETVQAVSELVAYHVVFRFEVIERPPRAPSRPPKARLSPDLGSMPRLVL